MIHIDYTKHGLKAKKIESWIDQVASGLIEGESLTACYRSIGHAAGYSVSTVYNILSPRIEDIANRAASKLRTGQYLEVNELEKLESGLSPRGKLYVERLVTNIHDMGNDAIAHLVPNQELLSLLTSEYYPTISWLRRLLPHLDEVRSRLLSYDRDLHDV